MEYRTSKVGGGRSEEAVEPRYSRLFLLGGKNSTEDELKEVFSRFGEVEYVSVKKDRNTNAPKGFAYIKFRKTSAAADALEEMNGKTIGDDPRPIKIVIAAEKKDGSKEEVKATRLFMKVPKTMDIPDIKEVFELFGSVEHVTLVRDKSTGQPRGLAFVNFHKFSDAARAVENCDKNFQAVFAEPRESNAAGQNHPLGGNSSSRRGEESMGGMGSMGSGMRGGSFHPDMRGGDGIANSQNAVNAMMNFVQCSLPPAAAANIACRLRVQFNPSVNKEMFWALFNVVPGLVSCDLADLTSDGVAIAAVVYNNPQSAVYALTRLNGFEYPTGSRLQIMLDESASGLPSSRHGGSNMMPAGGGYANGMGGSLTMNAGGGGSSGMRNTAAAVPPNVQTLISTIQEATNALKQSGFGDMVGGGGGGFGGNVDAEQCCSVNLPPRQPILPPNTRTAERLFFLFRDLLGLPDPAVVADTFCRFGNLIDAQCIPGKKCGYARFGDKKSAGLAIRMLNGAELLGSRIKVEVADEERRGKRPRTD